VVVHVDADALSDANDGGQSALEGGANVSAETSRRRACDASRVVMRHDPDGRVVEVDARTRTIPPALRRALQHRDRGCRFPGCGLPVGQGHHIRHWAHGGPTTLSNLALLCRRHHRAVHEEGFGVKRLSDGTLEFRRPNGWVLPQVPAPAAVPADPAGRLQALYSDDGGPAHRRLVSSGWFGERLDVGYVIDVTHPRAIGY
jgi:5-methylcytosine-specific restriction endonuclease McrA